MAAGSAFVELEISASLKIILGRGRPLSSRFWAASSPSLPERGGNCKQVATLNLRCWCAERPSSLCLRGWLKCVESGEGEHLAWGRPGPWPAPGLRRPESSLRPAGTPVGAGLGLFPVYSAILYFLKRFHQEGVGEEGKILVAALFRAQIV